MSIEAGTLADGQRALAAIAQSDELPHEDGLYKEAYRPQFHFTSRRGWLNDPNGLVYADGQWRLFYQHNPYGWEWGNMHWGHAVSSDLLHWREMPATFVPWADAQGACFSGCAVVDPDNTAGFQQGADLPIVAALTDTAVGEVIAFSNDRGRTWTMYEGNPVIRHHGRDPKIIWHEPTARWIMAVYEEVDNSQSIAFYSSPDLKKWQYESRIDGFYECPDLFALPVDGDPNRRTWVLYGADGRYVLGDFDGKDFHPETDKQQLWHGHFYAGQTFSDAPDGRRVQIGWGRGITFPGMPFNQQMTIPVDLTLKSTADGVRMCAEPVGELTSLREDSTTHTDLRLGEEVSRFDGGELLDIEAEFELGSASSLGIRVRGRDINFDAAQQRLSSDITAHVGTPGGRLQLRILVDRGSLEIFAGDGQAVISRGVLMQPDDTAIAIQASGGSARLARMTVHRLRSVWR